ncbi:MULTISPECIES: IS66 family insertion sequence element accessory protein TnpA [Idiomarina]|uniref:IS66 family insertion sequence element accessory protein TnpA n=1 Tax=Idiomarina TaxID=135575 RepID=UPI00129D0324|nr:MULTISPECIES: hypothetical protein [Idiomarina]MRJ43270.1 hypothetical protein [Idiomarina sp. FeN1]NCU58776.1 hypothetical protein [Idiomarina sp. FenA--70]NCU61482.1 hypothetical protein [Idiomarina sp. FenBw--71]UUN14341.1 hypothetical protein KGF88_03750 [Idiomarina loihiensis]
MSRTHRSHAQWLELFEAFEQSGQTQAAFCAERALNPGYFCKRRRELLEEHDNGFVQAQQVVYDSNRALTLRYGQLELTLPLHIEPQWLAQLVKSLGA